MATECYQCARVLDALQCGQTCNETWFARVLMVQSEEEPELALSEMRSCQSLGGGSQERERRAVPVRIVAWSSVTFV